MILGVLFSWLLHIFDKDEYGRTHSLKIVVAIISVIYVASWCGFLLMFEVRKERLSRVVYVLTLRALWV